MSGKPNGERGGREGGGEFVKANLLMWWNSPTPLACVHSIAKIFAKLDARRVRKKVFQKAFFCFSLFPLFAREPFWREREGEKEREREREKERERERKGSRPGRKQEEESLTLKKVN